MDYSKILPDWCSVSTDEDNSLVIEPSYLKLQSIHIIRTTKGMYIADPSTVPEALKDKNILWLDQPIEVTAITESGLEIPVYLSNMDGQVIIENNVIEPGESQ